MNKVKVIQIDGRSARLLKIYAQKKQITLDEAFSDALKLFCAAVCYTKSYSKKTIVDRDVDAISLEQ